MNRPEPRVLTDKQLAWLRENVPFFADSERQWKASRNLLAEAIKAANACDDRFNAVSLALTKAREALRQIEMISTDGRILNIVRAALAALPVPQIKEEPRP